MQRGELPVDGNSYIVKHPLFGLGKTVGFPSKHLDFPEVVQVKFNNGVYGAFDTSILELVKES